MVTEKQRDRFDITIDGHTVETKKREEQRRPQHISAWAAFEFFGQVGLSISLPMVSGTILGAYLDSSWHTKPEATIAGLALGFLLSIGSFLVTIKQFKKRFT